MKISHLNTILNSCGPFFNCAASHALCYYIFLRIAVTGLGSVTGPLKTSYKY